MCSRLTGCARPNGAGQDQQGYPQEVHGGGTAGGLVCGRSYYFMFPASDGTSSKYEEASVRGGWGRVRARSDA
jgi:hypothetical protein